MHAGEVWAHVKLHGQSGVIFLNARNKTAAEPLIRINVGAAIPAHHISQADVG
jgi:hypothetical protein